MIRAPRRPRAPRKPRAARPSATMPLPALRDPREVREVARALLLAAPRLRPRVRELLTLVSGAERPILSDRQRRQMFDALAAAVDGSAAEEIARCLAGSG